MSYMVNGKKIPTIAVGTWAWGKGMNGSKMIFGQETDEAAFKEAFDIAYNSGFLKGTE